MRQSSKRVPDSAERRSGIFAEPHAGIILPRIDAYVLEGLRGEDSIAELCRRGRNQSEPLLPLVEGVPGGRQETSNCAIASATAS